MRLAIPLCCLLAMASLSGQTLSIQDALALADAKPSDYIATSSTGLRDVAVVGPLGRIALEAHRAKQKYQPYTEADVSDALLTPAYFVEVVPRAPVRQIIGGGSYVLASPVTHVVLRAKDVIVQPDTFKAVPHAWGNALGGKAETMGAEATFSTVPDGDFEVVVIGTDGEKVHKISGKNRKKLR